MIGCPVTACIVLLQKSCGNKIPVPQSLYWRPPADQKARGLWVRDWVTVLECKVAFLPSQLIPLCLRLQVVEKPNLVDIMTTIEELQGVLAGPVSVVKDLTTNVSQVTQTVGQMADAVPTTSHHDKNQGLRMPSMQLPSFHGDSVLQDDISEFLERSTQQTSHLPAETRL